MTKLKDSPAFPLPCQDDRDCGERSKSGYGGMTLRQYYAGKAMEGMLSSITLSRGADDCVKLVSDAAVKHADGLIAELEKSEEK